MPWTFTRLSNYLASKGGLGDMEEGDIEDSETVHEDKQRRRPITPLLELEFWIESES